MPYFDQASTSFPKPSEVSASILDYLNNFGVSAGRGNYRLAELAHQRVEETRVLLADLLGVTFPENIAFTQNATHALNTILKGFLTQGDHVIICEYSHNAALRPLEFLRRERKIEIDILPVDLEGSIDLAVFEKVKKSNTKLLVATGASNVIGVKADLARLLEHCRQEKIATLIDLTQSLIYTDKHPPADFYVGTGHKSLLGPSGIGFFYANDPSLISSFIEGGSPGNSSLSLYHPQISPFKFEGGTLNGVGISGLSGALKYIQKRGSQQLAGEGMVLLKFLLAGLKQIPGLTIYGTQNAEKKIPLVSFNVKGWLPQEIAHELDRRFDIAVRSGLHCAPLMHRKLETIPSGTVRASLGHLNTKEEVELFLHALQTLYKERNP